MGGPEGSSPASEASGSGCFTPPAEAVRRRRSADDPEWGARGEAAPRAKRADQAASLPRRKRSAEGGALTIQNGGNRIRTQLCADPDGEERLPERTIVPLA